MYWERSSNKCWCRFEQNWVYEMKNTARIDRKTLRNRIRICLMSQIVRAVYVTLPIHIIYPRYIQWGGHVCKLSDGVRRVCLLLHSRQSDAWYIHTGQGRDTPVAVELKFDKLKALLRRFKWSVSMLNYYFYWTSRVLHTNALLPTEGIFQIRFTGSSLNMYELTKKKHFYINDHL